MNRYLDINETCPVSRRDVWPKQKLLHPPKTCNSGGNPCWGEPSLSVFKQHPLEDVAINGFNHYDKEQVFVDIGFRKLWDRHLYICAQETRLRLQSLRASQQQVPQHGCSDGYNKDWQNYCRPSCRAIWLKRKWSSKSFFGREVCWLQHASVCILASWKLNS